MDNALYVGLSKQVTLQRELDIAANNMANVDTAGFKVETLMLETDPETPARAARTAPISYVLDNGLARDFSEGSLESTGNTYDVAVQGDAFFEVQTALGPRYTRDGRFTVDTQSRLVTQDGDPVVTASGTEITIDPKKSPPSIGKDGVITQADTNGQVTQVGKLTVVRFARPSGLSKESGNLFSSPETPLAASDAQLRQGVVEHSNVNPMLQMTKLIDITRAYERVQNLINQSQDLSKSAVERLGKAA